MKNWIKFYLCMVVAIFSENPAFYRQKPRGERCEKIGGANAPPNFLTKPRICDQRVWPGGHTLLVVLPGFSIYIYLQLDLQFKSGILTKWPLILGFNRSICRDLFQLVFNLSDLPRSALIPWFRIYSDLIQNLIGFWAHFSSLSFRNGPANKSNI